MANAAVFPFDFNPASVSYKTSSYSIPAGQRARVIVLDFEAAFTIGGTTVIPQLQKDSSYNLNTGGVGEIYRNQTGYELEIIIDIANYGSGSPVIAVFGPDATASGGSGTAVYDELGARAYYTISANANYPRISLPPNSFFYLVTSGGGASCTAHYMVYPKKLPPVTEFWVPSGTSLNGSGYQVELYDDIS